MRSYTIRAARARANTHLETTRGSPATSARQPWPASSGDPSPLASGTLGSTFRPWPQTFWPIAVPMTEASNRLIDSVYAA